MHPELSASVVIPTYNRAHLVRRAVESVLAQTRPCDEVIVVDDGSTDATPDVLSAFGGRIRALRIPNGGAGAARNAGLRHATGDLVMFLDSDDEWLPGKLEIQRAFMQARPDVLFSAADFMVEVDGTHHPNGLGWWRKDPRTWEEIIGPGLRFSDLVPLSPGWQDFTVYIGDFSTAFLQDISTSINTLAVRRAALDDSVRLPEDLPTFEDWEFFGRLSRRGTGAHLDYAAAVQHGHEGPRLTDAALLVRVASRLTLTERVWGDGAFLAEHGDEYRAVCRQQRLLRLRALIARGEPRQARAEMASIENVPARYRLMAATPRPLLRALLGIRRRLRSGRAAPTLKSRDIGDRHHAQGRRLLSFARQRFLDPRRQGAPPPKRRLPDERPFCQPASGAKEER